MPTKTQTDIFEAFMTYTWDGYDAAEMDRFGFTPREYENAVMVAETLGAKCVREWTDEYENPHRDYQFPDGSHSIVIMQGDVGTGLVG